MKKLSLSIVVKPLLVQPPNIRGNFKEYFWKKLTFYKFICVIFLISTTNPTGYLTKGLIGILRLKSNDILSLKGQLQNHGVGYAFLEDERDQS